MHAVGEQAALEQAMLAVQDDLATERAAAAAAAAPQTTPAAAAAVDLFEEPEAELSEAELAMGH